jgi:hypothetical protein
LTCKKIHILIAFVWLFALPQHLSAQDVPDSTLTHNPRTKKIIASSVMGAHTLMMLYVEYKWWWEGDYHPFKMAWEGFSNDYSLGLDKLGHFYISYFYSNAAYQFLTWGGFSGRTAQNISIALPLVYALSVEIGDGFSTFQFSPDDLMANSLGVLYSYLQHKYRVADILQFKWSYFPSEAFRNHQIENVDITDDYDGHIYWLTANIHEIAPNVFQKKIFQYINLGVGYGVENVSHGVHGTPFRQWMFGLDFNLRKMFEKQQTLNKVCRILSPIHLPAPALRMQQNSLSGEWLMLN